MTEGPGRTRHGLLDREPTIADLPSTENAAKFFADPGTVIRSAVRQGIVAANEEIYTIANNAAKAALAANDEHFRDLVREGMTGAYRARNL